MKSLYHPGPGLKVCSRCRNEQPLSAFSKQWTTPDGLRPHCKACQASDRKATRQRETLQRRVRKLELHTPPEAVVRRLSEEKGAWLVTYHRELRARAWRVHQQFLYYVPNYTYQDLLQDFTLKMYLSQDSSLPPTGAEFVDKAYFYLRQVALNKLKLYRRQREEETLYLAEGVYEDTETYSALRTELIEAAVTLLNPLQQQLVYWRCEGLSNGEVAERLAIPEHRVKSGICAAKKLLKIALSNN